jgi:hypothetical protein
MSTEGEAISSSLQSRMQLTTLRQTLSQSYQWQLE